MKSGQMVKCRLGVSHFRAGQLGLVLEFINMANRSGYPEAEFCRVLWFKEGEVSLIKAKHLEGIS